MSGRSRRLATACAALVALATAGAIAVVPGRAGTAQTPVVTVALDAPLSSFAPATALGAGVDGQDQGALPGIYTRTNLRAMRSAGLRSLTYRLRTELAGEVWHWSPYGRWSDPARHRGYWTSIARPGERFKVTYGYRLPRRGNTIDQANDDGYSRLDDGDARSYWKSDPYLDPHYTHQSEALHRQWVVVDLGRPMPVDGVRLEWGNPYARAVEVQYWAGPDESPDLDGEDGRFVQFPHAQFAGTGGGQTLRVADSPLFVRQVRVLFAASSHSAPRGSRDIRDRLGFAIREIHVGRLAGSRLVDEVHHAPSNQKQSTIWVSSTDPWHAASDIDANNQQPSFSRVLSSGLTGGLPAMVPVPVLYGTPSDAEGEVRYLRALHFPLGRIELGEEPDGQLVTPEDYGALYAQFARAIHRVAPHAVLGGPAYATSLPDWRLPPDSHGNYSFTSRFVEQLRREGAERDLDFFSFEWYPVDDACSPGPTELAAAPSRLASVLAAQHAEGIPRGMPVVISEYGYSSFAAGQMVDMTGALLNADIVGYFLSTGGRAAYLYGYEPAALINEPGPCATWGNLILFLARDSGRIIQPVATYWETRLLTRDWTEPGLRRHTILATSSSESLVSAYSLRRPDGRLSLLLVNKDPAHGYEVRIDLSRGGRSVAPPSAFDVFRLSSAQYVWHPRGPRGRASPDRPPQHATVHGDIVSLPPYSLTVVRSASAVRF